MIICGASSTRSASWWPRSPTGSVGVGGARQQINAMALRSNRWTVGAHCAGYCYLLTTHHTLEDQAMFPGLRRTDARLGPVLDRLAEEHRIIHDVLGRLDAALVDFVAGRGDDTGCARWSTS